MTAHPSILGLIPARGGSRRLPGKNIVPFQGKPLISHTIDVALASGVLDRVIVSTDAQNIADVASAAGADVPFLRPATLATDTTPSEEVLLHAVNWLQREEKYTPVFIMLLQPTSPLRSAADIGACVAMATTHNADAVVSVTSSLRATRALVEQDDGFVHVVEDIDAAPEESLYVNGAIYLIRTQTFLEEGTLYPARTMAYVMPEERSADIDTAEDLRRVQSA